MSAEQATSPAAVVEDDKVVEEEVTEGDWNTPQIEVHEVVVHTGEEDEEEFWKCRSKLFRWEKSTSEWKERGLGESKLLKHKETGKIRFLLRQEKTLKIVANHYVIHRENFCQLVPNVSSDKIWVWTVNDFADDELVLQQFALKFGQKEQADNFKKMFEEAAKHNESKFNISKTAPSSDKKAEAKTAEPQTEAKKEEPQKKEPQTEKKEEEASATPSA